ncbi:MAG: hypothetical protein ABEJ66_02615, partial [Candidatus Nanohaloarchaea archaeon]
MASYLFGGRAIEEEAVEDIADVFEHRTGEKPEVHSEGGVTVISSRPGIEQGELQVAFNGYLLGRQEEPEKVVARLYREKGPELVEELEGQFRYLVYDSDRDRFTASADVAGRKVVYYTGTGSGLVCSSHLAPILRPGGVEAEASREGIS